MSYQVLARKWRPKSFEELMGQDSIQKALTNALDQNRLHHAYLLTGTRGVGKTTIARIMAKCLNCETGITSKPCGVCQACKEIDEGRFVDLIEVDAASRTKVEDTRELLDNVIYTPTKGRFKIYLIDEVHMLSGHSFNALLKTLEEPPAHVKFLLATTDPQKLPITVLSRCLQFNLKNLTPDVIKTHLESTLEKENIEYESPALLQIAKAAQGSMRDALSLLDQAIAFCNGKLQTQDINTMLGTIDTEFAQTIIQALIEKSPEKLLEVSDSLAQYGADFKNALESLISYLHSIAVAQFVPTSNQNETISAFTQKLSPQDIQLYYQIAITGRRDLPLASDPKSGFEMTLLRLLAFTPFDSKNELKTQQKPTLQTQLKTTEPSQTTSANPIHIQTPQKQPESKPAPEQKPALTEDSKWSEICQYLNLTGMTQTLALNCVLKSKNHDHFVLSVKPTHSALVNDKIKTRLTDALKTYYQKPVRLTIDVEHSKIETPAETAARKTNEQQTAAIDSMEKDPNITLLREKLGATLKPEHVSVRE